MSENFIVCYDKSNGERVRAFESPLEPGVYHYPANSTTLRPPFFNEDTEVVKFENDEWIVKDKTFEDKKEGLPSNFNTMTDEQKIANFYELDEDDIEAIDAKISEIGGKESPAFDSIVNPPVENVTDSMQQLSYVELRMKAYGEIYEQIEFITENGLDAWQDKVKKIKQLYPKNNDIVSW